VSATHALGYGCVAAAFVWVRFPPAGLDDVGVLGVGYALLALGITITYRAERSNGVTDS